MHNYGILSNFHVKFTSRIFRRSVKNERLLRNRRSAILWRTTEKKMFHILRQKCRVVCMNSESYDEIVAISLCSDFARVSRSVRHTNIAIKTGLTFIEILRIKSIFLTLYRNVFVFFHSFEVLSCCKSLKWPK